MELNCEAIFREPSRTTNSWKPQDAHTKPGLRSLRANLSIRLDAARLSRFRFHKNSISTKRERKFVQKRSILRENGLVSTIERRWPETITKHILISSHENRFLPRIPSSKTSFPAHRNCVSSEIYKFFQPRERDATVERHNGKAFIMNRELFCLCARCNSLCILNTFSERSSGVRRSRVNEQQDEEAKTVSKLEHEMHKITRFFFFLPLSSDVNHVEKTTSRLRSVRSAHVVVGPNEHNF